MTTQKNPVIYRFQLGTVIEGTLKTEELLEAFADELGKVGGRWKNADGELIAIANRWLEDRNFVWDGEWDKDEATEIVQTLENVLNEYAPPFVYFGAHPGDGAAFGWWVDFDSMEEAIRNGEETDDSETRFLPDDNVLVHTNDHGNVTVMDMQRNVLWAAV